ncbi:TPA: hypothetical protein MH337_28595 [Klebsiella pneumoniae]|nr:hypothetical protein [Klebsiella pneumoniae]HBX4914176.1 hypothetical protein [Klebsiella pneumoniae]
MVKTVHTVHFMFLLFIFKVLAREYSVNSEHFTVHLRGADIRKSTARLILMLISMGLTSFSLIFLALYSYINGL